MKLGAEQGEIPALQAGTRGDGGNVEPSGAEATLEKRKEGVSQREEIAKGRPDQGGAFH
jgi:hypothetical protein